MKKASRKILIVLLATISVFAFAACGDGATSETLILAVGLEHTYENQQWTAVAASVKSGWTKRTVTVDEDNLAAFRVQSTTGSGVLTLRITQGETTKEVDISNFDDRIELEQFTAGKITIELRYDTIRGMYAVIGWRV